MATRKPTTPEQKARYAAAHRKRYAENPEYRNRAIELASKRVLTPEQKDRRKARAAAHFQELYGTPEYRNSQTAKSRKRYAEDPEYRSSEATRDRAFRGLPQNRARIAERVRFRKYGITPEEHAAMVKAQGGVCAICKQRKKLVVDHCHEAGIVRGLLCSGCNTAIGKLGDTPAGLMRAVKYLRDARKRQQLPLIDIEL